MAPLLRRLASVVGASPGELEAVYRAAALEAHGRRGGAVGVTLLALGESWDAFRTLRRGSPSPLQGVAQDVRHALRQLVARPGFAALAVLALGLGIGANTAIFTVVKGVLLDALPYPEPERLVRIYGSWEGQPRGALSTGEFLDYADGATTFQSMGAVASGAANLNAGDTTERLPVAFVTEGLLATLGVNVAEGRSFTADDFTPGAGQAVLLTYGLWQRRFGGAPDVVGSDVLLSGGRQRVVGILPAGFRLPGELAGATRAELLLPFPMTEADRATRGSHFIAGFGRLRPGVLLADAEQEVDGIVARFTTDWADEYPDGMGFAGLLVPLHEDLVGDVRPLLLVLLGAVGLVLIIACVNVAGLLLARADERRREFAVRAALGAGRGRLARQVTVESLVLALLGGAAGVVVAYQAVPLLLALRPPDVPRLEDVAVDASALLFALFAAVATGLIFGLAPLSRVLGRNVQAQLREGQRAGHGRAAQRGRRLLVVGEMALALVLVTGAGLLLRSFGNLMDVDPGYVTDGVLTTRVSLPGSAYPENAQVVAFYQQLTERLDALPGVTAAAAVTNLPLDGSLGDMGVNFERWYVPEGQDKPGVDWQAVTPGYFAAMDMEVVEGRGILPTDDASAPGAAVFNRAAVDALIPPGEEAIGQRLELGGGAGPGWVTVVGIVADIRHAALDAAPRPEMYIPHAQFTFWGSNRTPTGMALVLRTDGATEAAAPAIRRTVAALDPGVALAPFETMAQKRSASVARPRFAMTLVGLFAVVAVLLTAVGIYGVFAYSVRRRGREMAVRMALGARGAEVASLVLREAAALAAAGTILGLAGALALGRGLRGLLYGIQPTDPLTLAAATLVLCAVSLLSTWIPAWRATRVSPATTLREDG